MKTTKVLILILGLAVVLQPVAAQAINREWSAALGFLGGMLVANASRGQPVYYEPVVVHQPVVVPQPVYVEQPVEYGYYEYREQPIWVPGVWVYVGPPHCQRRTWQPGYYRTEMVRVWVSGCAPRRHRDGRYSHHRRR